MTQTTPRFTEGRPRRRSPLQRACLAALIVVSACLPAHAVQVQDIVRIKGSEGSKLVGMGLVFGLDGTGDGGKYLPAMRQLAQVIGQLGDPNVIAAELRDTDSVAVVALTAALPATGVREGDKVDVQVTCMGPASSLEGGRLFLVPMQGPLPGSPVYAFAEGAISIEDPESPRTAVVHDGAQLTKDVFTQYLDAAGQMQLVINNDNANWTVAHNLAALLNGLLSPDGPEIARAIDQKTVVVRVPQYERQNPAAFISQIMQTYIDPTQVSTEARVVINEQTGTIVVTGDVEISPVVISHKGMTITTVTPEPQPTDAAPKVEEAGFVAIDPAKKGGTRLADLLAAFNQLKVPAEDRIEIIKTIAKSGKLHAKLIIE